ncbi:hypothetical protein FACS1894137_07230 [Spirochaetia bacterium]|nr:hypothetical protein FACS1894137_07230 [Spirochaetia bacterium]
MGYKEKTSANSLLEADKNPLQYGSVVPEWLERVRQVRKKVDKEFRERFRNFEPYKLEEIERIISKVKKDNANEKNEQKVSAFLIALEKIELIIKNSRLVYENLEKEGEISAPENYWNALDEANNLKKQLEIEIAELRLETSKQAEPNIDKKSINDFPLETNNPTTEPSTDKLYITLKELAIILSVSESTFYHNKEIITPYLGIGGYRFPSSDIDKLRIALKSKSASKKNVDAVSKMPIPNKEKKHHFIFQVSLEPFTNVFVEKGYIDKDNAILMNDRFSKEPKLGNKLIEWKKDTRSLITFIYLADRLGLIDKSRSINVRAHNTSFAEPKENDEEGREIKYTNLVKENFVIDAESGSSDPMLTRWWNGTLKIKGINMIICELRIQAAVKSGLISKEEDEEKAKQKMTRKEAIEYYFAKKDSTYFKFDKDADRQMLDIVCEVMKSTENESPNTTQKRPLLDFSSASL